MDKYLVCILLIFISRSVTGETDLIQQNDEQTDPVNEYNYDNPSKDQDKRTIFGKTYGLARHVGVHPSGFKYVLGYGGVNLKYLPVMRPISLRPYGYRPHHHKFQFAKPLVLRPLLPAKRPSNGWKPIPRPVIPPHIPLPPHLLTKPWEQQGWSDGEPTNVKPVIPLPPPAVPSPPAVPVKPVVPALPQPVFPVRPALPASPVFSVQPVLPAVKPPIQPGIPLTPSVFSPAPIFEVTRPNLPVLPFGASFPSQVLQQVPAGPGLFSVTHFKFLPPENPAAPPFIPQPGASQPVVPSTLIPQPIVPPAVVPQVPVPAPAPPGLLPRPFIPQPIFPQAAVPQAALPPPVLPQPAPQPAIPPGTVLEFHGTKNFIATGGQIPGVFPRVPFHPQIPVNAVQPIIPSQFPDGQVPVISSNQPNFVNTLLPPHFVPQGSPNVFEQQPPLVSQTPQAFQPQIPHHQGNIFHQQLPLDNGQQHEVFQHQGNIFQQQLPQDNGQQHELFQHQGNIFQQQLPQDNGQQHEVFQHQGNIFQQQLPQDNGQQHEVFQHHHNIVQQELPENQPTTLFSEQFPVDNTNDQRQVLQPGETDLQFPMHLPNHPNFFQNTGEFQGGNFHDPQQHPDNVLRPSVSLEAPYKRSDNE